tara:strand:- start:65 stop:634 length:570 start_codon:yes stop_codon:yes gene_type:complete
MTNKIILMIGGPATGKTTVGKILAKHFGLPFFSKDGVKEPIFDYVGCPTSIENESPLSGTKMDDAAQAILFHLLEMQISVNKGCLFDSTFGKSHVEELNRIFKHYDHKPIQIVCYAKKNILKERYYNRAINSLRHPGHLDTVLAESFEKINSLYNAKKPLDLSSYNFLIDTSANNDKEINDIILSIDKI